MPFDDIYLEYYQRCFLFAKSYLQDEMLSKDIASEAMIILWTTMKTEEVKNVRSFLMTVVKNQALNHLRNEHLRMEARESILADELYELDFRIASLYGAQNEAYMSRSAEKWVRALCFNELGVCG